MKIEIMSIQQTIKTLSNGDTRPIISCVTQDERTFFNLDELLEKVEHIKLEFEDLITPIQGHVRANKEHIEKAIDFSRGKDNIIVHCNAGVCRSAAVAMVVMNANEGLEEAKKVADMTQHSPNEWIIELGDHILGTDLTSWLLQEVEDKMEKWIERNDNNNIF